VLLREQTSLGQIDSEAVGGAIVLARCTSHPCQLRDLASRDESPDVAAGGVHTEIAPDSVHQDQHLHRTPPDSAAALSKGHAMSDEAHKVRCPFDDLTIRKRISHGCEPNNVVHETCSRRARRPRILLLVDLASGSSAVGP
jgi:hypothetical protein